MTKKNSGVRRAREAFDATALRRVCEMHEHDFGHAYGLTRVPVLQRQPADFYYYADNGSDILAVAHLDTVVEHFERECAVVDTFEGPVVHSGALDDRLGAYVLLELLPRLGIKHDILLTVGEEMGCSTAQFFEPTKEYNWMIEFDRGGTDVVMYEYEDAETCALVEATGADVGMGSFSDICYLEHLEVKGFNWGVGYQGNYHSTRAFAYLEDTFGLVAQYLRFHEANAQTYLPHERRPKALAGGWQWDDDTWYQDDGRSTYLCNRYGCGYTGHWYCSNCGNRAAEPESEPGQAEVEEHAAAVEIWAAASAAYQVEQVKEESNG